MPEKVPPVDNTARAEITNEDLLRALERLERKTNALANDFNGLYTAVVSLQNDVGFFTRRCEARAKTIRDFVDVVQDNGSVPADAALRFLQELECAGTPVRPPSGNYPAVGVKDVHERFGFDPDDPTPES